jgi:NhaP-type Na+/H+ or K+/H+ antiporter
MTVLAISEPALIDLAIVLLLGIGAQWLAWRLHWPAIVLLLMFGFLAGPILGLVEPDPLLGHLLEPLVSIFVAIILFEGGLTLRWQELKNSTVVLRLLTIGAGVTWVLAAVGAYWLLDLRGHMAVLLGAILIVTGPTVVIPLLRHAQLKQPVSQILKWEGILIDPVGAVLAVLVFEGIRAGQGAVASEMVWGLAAATVSGTAVALLGVGLLVPLLRYYWIPDYLESPVTLSLVIGAFALADWLQPESGLLAVTLMGAILINQPWAHVRHIARFKENLSVLVLSLLFIFLAARIPLSAMEQLGWASVAFLLWLMLIVRPIGTVLSTLGSGITWRERTYLAAIAPRGIVAAAVASTFALNLDAAEHPAVATLVPLTFLVIVATTGVSSLVARPLAKVLDLAQPRQDGYLILGAHIAARRIATALQEADIPVLLLDENRTNIRKARMEELPAHHGNIISDDVLDEPPLAGLGRLLALSSSDEANSLAVLRLAELFDRSKLYQLPPEDPAAHNSARSGRSSDARYLFGKEVTYSALIKAIYRGAEIKTTPLTEQFDYAAFQQHYGQRAVPLFYITEAGDVLPVTSGTTFDPKPGQHIIALLSNNEPESTLADHTGDAEGRP